MYINKITSNKLWLCLIVMLSLVNTACNKEFLDRPQQDGLTVDQFFSTEAQVKQGTSSLYNAPWFDFNDKALWAIGDITGGNLNTGDPAVVNFKVFQVTGDNNRIVESWNSLFNAVGQANNIINKLPVRVAANVDPIAVKRAVGEAKFMRALAYFYLVRLWGAVPIIEDNNVLIANAIVPRNRVEDIYTFILKDLEYVEANCPKRSGYSSADLARVTQGSAQALMAKVYLYQKNYTKAREKAELVINSGEYELMADYADIFKSKNNVNLNSANKETIFAFVWQVDLAGWGVQNTNQAYFAAYGEGLTDGWDGWGSAVPTIDILKAYESGDRRMKATFMTEGNFYPELKAKKGGYTYPLSSDKVLSGTRGNIKKYVVGTPDDNGGIGSSMKTYVNTNILRLSEVYLIAAEAIMAGSGSTSDAKALEYLNKVRMRAGLAAKTTVSFDELFKERRLELAVEADYWFDLGRIDRAKAIAIISNQERGLYGTFPDIASQKVTPKEQDFVFPLPNAEVAKNPTLKDAPVAYKF